MATLGVAVYLAAYVCASVRVYVYESECAVVVVFSCASPYANASDPHTNAPSTRYAVACVRLCAHECIGNAAAACECSGNEIILTLFLLFAICSGYMYIHYNEWNGKKCFIYRISEAKLERNIRVYSVM